MTPYARQSHTNQQSDSRSDYLPILDAVLSFSVSRHFAREFATDIGFYAEGT